MTVSTRGAATRRMTLADVANLAQVDRSVVSRVFNKDPRLSIRPETRQRVIEAMAELGYRPNAMARSLRTQRTGTIGLLVPDFANPVSAEVIQGAEEEAASAGSVLLTGSAQRGDNPTKTYLDLLGEGRVDGLLLVNPPSERESLQLAARTNLPWLLLNGVSAEHSRYIAVDDSQAVSVAVRHLIELGHSRIAFVSGSSSEDIGVRARRGWQSALHEAGLNASGELAVRGDDSCESGVKALHTLLELPVRPTAIVVSNPQAAIGVVHGAALEGVSIPGDMSVVAIHDYLTAAYIGPGLTAVRLPLRKLGSLGVRRLFDAGADAEVAEMIDSDIELVVRGSTAPRR